MRAFYVSDAITAEFINASYTKTVDNTDPRNVSTQKGKVNRAESDSSGGISGFGYVFGYRRLLGSGSFFLSGEFDILLFHEGRVYGDIEEKGSSEGTQTNLERVGPKIGRLRGTTTMDSRSS